MTSQRTRARMVRRLAERGIGDERVLELMGNMPRHLFVDEALASRAYEDVALPIGYGQTISQPYVVAKMTETLFAGHAPERVLEVGTGSAYQSAILSQLVPRVFTVERIPELFTQAKIRLKRFGIRNVVCGHSDGHWGWEENAPYDGILVTAAPEDLPLALLEQLTVGGRLVIPIGGTQEQQLRVIHRTGGAYEEEVLESVNFVPLVEGY
ncbi:MAG: protein-L-isoaspartate(D-aspartate) O-methyltransferase [Pseudomonadota bacterium]|nr:protein-L-isoaspartate(D-aspartate) O-methyltransferase [Pseudomonadota bacterium]